MEGVAEVRAECIGGPKDKVGKMVVVATFRSGGCCRHARMFADILEASSEIWFVERDEKGRVFTERLLDVVPLDFTERKKRHQRIAELEETIKSAETELNRLKRTKIQ